MLKEFIEKIIFSEPKMLDSVDVWKKFLQKASFERVVHVYEKYRRLDCFVSDREKIFLMLQRLIVDRQKWMKLSANFVEKHQNEIFVVKSLETAKREVNEKYKGCKPLYLVDENNQMLGIVIDRCTIISVILKKPVSRCILEMFRGDYSMTVETMNKIFLRCPEINKMLKAIRFATLGGSYWVKDASGEYVIWKVSSYTEMQKSVFDTAYLMFLL